MKTYPAIVRLVILLTMLTLYLIVGLFAIFMRDGVLLVIYAPLTFILAILLGTVKEIAQWVANLMQEFRSISDDA